MKKIGITILFILSFLLLTNCNKEVKKEEVKNEKINFSDDTYKLFEKFANNKKDVMEKLKTLNKKEANIIYEQYVIDNNSILANIEKATEKFLDGIYCAPEGKEFTEEDWKATDKILNKYDLELWDIGEGIVTIRELPHFYYDIFKDYVTDDYKEYLKIWAKDDEKLYQADAGLMISFEELEVEEPDINLILKEGYESEGTKIVFGEKLKKTKNKIFQFKEGKLECYTGINGNLEMYINKKLVYIRVFETNTYNVTVEGFDYQVFDDKFLDFLKNKYKFEVINGNVSSGYYFPELCLILIYPTIEDEERGVIIFDEKHKEYIENKTIKGEII